MTTIRGARGVSINSDKKRVTPRRSLLIILCLASCLSVGFSFWLLWAYKNENDASLLISRFVDLGLPTTTRKQYVKPERQRSTAAAADAPVVAHVVSLIKCGRVAQTTGFLDAAAVLRHSIHQQSIHSGKSAYSYRMYAIIHTDCRHHASLLEKLGYTTLIKDTPVKLDEIQGDWYRSHVEGENCCGSKEFIKLYAYTLTDHPIAVHWDMDVAILQPLDDLFDAMLFSADSQRGKEARSNIELQHPNTPLPGKIDAFFTRDITSSKPWEKTQGVQGGFLVARPNLDDLQTYIDFIKEGNYKPGRGDGTGWAGLGYGGFQGAMAYQGAVAYFYDVFRPNTAVELNVCRWNQVVADVTWRGPEKFQEYHMQCRDYHQRIVTANNNTGGMPCEDCRVTPVELVKTVHYTACKKPWECRVPHPRPTRQQSQKYRLSHLTNISTCMKLFRKWFELRRDFEDSLSLIHRNRNNTSYVPSPRDGEFEKEYFMGYCRRDGHYVPMEPPPQDLDMRDIYGM